MTTSFGFCDSVVDSVRKRARVYMCTENPGINAVFLSLSLSLSSLRNYIYPWIVPLPMDCSKCVSMSICDAEIPNLSRHDFRRNATDRFDYDARSSRTHSHSLPPFSITHPLIRLQIERREPPSLSRSHKCTNERET